jgi:uncharacterized membrane protein YozB (DUF420 family)
MDPRLLYWTGALVNMAVIVAFALSGVRHRRRGDVLRHRRNMLVSASLIALFLLSYVLKLIFLGREHVEVWSADAVWTLRVHEACVLVMLVGGVIAGGRARRLARTRNATLAPEDPPAPLVVVRWHRGAGRAAVAAAVLALLTAALVLAAMYRRAGFF